MTTALARHDGSENDMPPLSWLVRDLEGPWPGVTRQLPDGRHIVIVTTCDQGHTGTLPHAVGADGAVSPSIVCAHAQDGCPWHVFARLDGWTGGALPRAGQP